MKKRFVFSILCISLMIVFLISCGFTLASWRVQNSTVNSITMGSVKGRIVEEYNQGQTVFPAATVNKKVQVENTGTMDVVVRVKVEKAWGDYREKDGKLVINPNLKTDNILIEYNTKDWMYKDDGYFYFKDVLKTGKITSSLFDSFTIDGKNTGGEYKNKNADIIVTMELVQAAYHGLSYWGMSFVDLGVTYTQNQEIPIVTSVDFKNPTEGFVFAVNDGDLFANFKNFTPGESRSQEITVTNSWNKKTEIFLNAEYVEQIANDETYNLVEKLLHENAIINISDATGKLIYSGAVYGSYDIDSKGTDSMKYPISLGTFESGETKTLYVSLYLSKNMNNEYKDLLGLVKWVFSAEGSQSDIDVPKTGDYSYVILYSCISVISAAIFIILLKNQRKKLQKHKIQIKRSINLF